MVAIINNSIVNNIIKNKDVRSESVDSFSSTIDVHAQIEQSKGQPDVDQLASALDQFGLVDNNGAGNSSQFDLLLPSNHHLTQQEQLLRNALSSILVLNSTSRPEVQALLNSYNGHLVDVGSHLLEGLRDAAPSQLAARVGDYNENLFYEMRDMDQDIGSIIRNSTHSGLDDGIQQDIDSFETSIRQSLQHTNLSYRGSFMQTEQTMYQPAHVDYDYPVLQSYGKRLFLAFFPLIEEGAFLQLWQDPMKDNCKDGRLVEGTVVYIPKGKMFLVPSDTIHGGGFKRGSGGNLRFHLYIALEENDAGVEEEEKDISLLHHPMNKYTEEHDRRRELCERFVDAKNLESLLGKFFDV